MDFILHKKYFYEIFKLNKALGADREDSIAHLFVQNRSQVLPGRLYYKPSKVGKDMNDGWAAFYNSRLDRVLFKILIEYKFKDESPANVLCQMLEYYMPIRCNIMSDYNYEVDKFRYFESIDQFKYWLLDLHKPEVVAILDEFAEEYCLGLVKSACTANKGILHQRYAKMLVPHLEIWDIEEMEDHEIVAKMLKDYCTEQSFECNIKFVNNGTDDGTNVAG